jgi:hypothetical protein
MMAVSHNCVWKIAVFRLAWKRLNHCRQMESIATRLGMDNEKDSLLIDFP